MTMGGSGKPEKLRKVCIGWLNVMRFRTQRETRT